MSTWNPEQKQTIELRNKNILVSAAAGSGKTTVLIERIKQLILDPSNPVDVDRFLITTFTNAAAAEMKGRMEKAIRKAMNEEGADKERLRRQLRLLPKANISTFHSFTIEVMKRYFYLTDLEPGVKIGDETQMEILKRESIDDVFDRRFAEDFDAFTAWLTKYSKYKNERDIKAAIVSIYNEMRSIPHYMREMGEKIAMMHGDPVKDLELDVFLENEINEGFDTVIKQYSQAVDILVENGLEKMSVTAQENLNTLQREIDHYKATGEWTTLDLATMRAPKDEKEEWNLVKSSFQTLADDAKKTRKSIAENYLKLSVDDCQADLKAQADDMDYLLDILKEFEQVFREKKAALVVVDFDDVMHYAIDILDDPTVQQEYRNKFEYIFVDEYQDSNQLQEYIVEAIGRDDNLFMVGDVKQSIYKFRQAEPELFMERYDLYADEANVNSVKIDLNKNYRSKKSVTRTVNDIFKEIMAGYDDNAALHCTVDDAYPGLETTLHIVNKAGYDDKDEMSEAEFKVIAQQIKNHVGMEVYNTQANPPQAYKLGYKDIVVLARGNDTIERLERYLNNEGIPAFGQSSGGYYETVELQVFINMLKVINNTRQDIPLISVMRSVAFDFTATEMAQIRIQFREGSFYSACSQYAESGSNELLRAKVSDMFETIRYWKKLNKSVSLEELVRTVMEETGYYDYCSGLPVGKQRISNLRLLIEKAAEFESANYTGLHGFLTYIEAMKTRDIKVGEAKVVGDGEDVVRLMTIHKSKGLEFPIVILAGMGKGLSMSSKSGVISMHKKYGLALPFVNRGEAWRRKTLLQKAITAEKKREYIEEEIRVLYVALTRAKDQLVLVGTVNDAEKLNEDVAEMSSYLKMVYPAVCKINDPVIVESEADQVDYDEKGAPAYVPQRSFNDILELSRKHRDEAKIAEIDKRLGYVYPYEDNGVKSKYSVSQLNHIEMPETKRDLNKSLFSDEKRVLSAAEVGTAMHAVMERMDFARALAEGEAYVVAKADEMAECGQLTTEERAAINIKNITAFFDTDLGARAARCAQLHKEREFILCKDIQGTDTIVQGIIDCYFVEDDGIVLIDYKNSYMGGETTEEVIRDRYQEQILLYKEALEEATGLPVKESYLYLFNLKNFTQIT